MVWESELRASSIVDKHSTSELRPETETILPTTKRQLRSFPNANLRAMFKTQLFSSCNTSSPRVIVPTRALGYLWICKHLPGLHRAIDRVQSPLRDSERNTLSHRNFSTLSQQSKHDIKMLRARGQGTCLSRAELPPGFLCPPQSADVTPLSQGSSRSTRRCCFLSWKVCPTRPAPAQDSHRIPLSSHWPAGSCRNNGHRCGERCFSCLFWNKIKSTLSS